MLCEDNFGVKPFLGTFCAVSACCHAAGLIKFSAPSMRMRAVSLALLGSLFGAGLQNVAGQNRQTFDSRVRPFLSKNCAGCHNAKANTANLDLASFADETSAAVTP